MRAIEVLVRLIIALMLLLIAVIALPLLIFDLLDLNK